MYEVATVGPDQRVLQHDVVLRRTGDCITYQNAGSRTSACTSLDEGTIHQRDSGIIIRCLVELDDSIVRGCVRIPLQCTIGHGETIRVLNVQSACKVSRIAGEGAIGETAPIRAGKCRAASLGEGGVIENRAGRRRQLAAYDQQPARESRVARDRTVAEIQGPGIHFDTPGVLTRGSLAIGHRHSGEAGGGMVEEKDPRSIVARYRQA